MANLEGQAAPGEPNSVTADATMNLKNTQQSKMNPNQTKQAYDVQVMQAKQGLQSPPPPIRANKTDMTNKRTEGTKSVATRSTKLQKTGQQVVGGPNAGKQVVIQVEHQKTITGKRLNANISE